MDRIEQLRNVVDEILQKNPDPEDRRSGFVHLYGVSITCTLLALRRGQNLELCSAAGMLHDIWRYMYGEDPDHGQLGTREAKKILQGLGNFSGGEVEIICHAIARHSDKESIDSDMDELLKDADVFQQYLYAPIEYLQIITLRPSKGSEQASSRHQRLERVLKELGISERGSDPG